MYEGFEMNMKIDVVFSDFDADYLERVCDHFQTSARVRPVGSTTEMEQVIPLLERTGAQVLVTNIQLSGGDGLELLRRLGSRRDLDVRIVVCSHFANPALVSRCAELGACSYVERPCLMEMLEEHICLAATGIDLSSRHEHYLTQRTDLLLRSLGFTPNQRSFHYIRYALYLWLESDCDQLSVTKHIYPAVAARCGTTPTAVERCIRHGIAKIWNAPASPLRSMLFPPNHLLNRRAPTNAQFLSALAFYLRRTWGSAAL